MKCAIKSFDFCEEVNKRECQIAKEAAIYAHLCMMKEYFGEAFEEALVSFLKYGGEPDVKDQP